LDRLPLHASFTIRGSERPAGAGLRIDSPVSISDG
jgi:hypothetical protein